MIWNTKYNRMAEKRLSYKYGFWGMEESELKMELVDYITRKIGKPLEGIE